MPKKLVIKNKEINEIKDIAEEFNKFFTYAGSKPIYYFLKLNKQYNKKKLAITKRVKGGFLPIKNKEKCPGYDDTNC